MSEQPTHRTLVVLAGPTASGKTVQAIELAKALNTEIISADSRQFYRELKIGTASPREDELKAVPHHFIGHLSIFEYYNASIYELAVLAKLEELFKKYPAVILTGGSGLYIDTVCNGIDDLPEVNQVLRDKLLLKLDREGLDGICKELEKVDPVSYRKIDLGNPKRVLKALEISLQTGSPYSSFLSSARRKRPFQIIKTGLMPGRELLYEQINLRVDKMLRQGLLEEAQELYPHRGINALNTVGYKEIFDYFSGKINLEEAVRLVKRNTRHYAKRQITWFARDKEYCWFLPGQTSEMLDYIFRKTNGKDHGATESF